MNPLDPTLLPEGDRRRLERLLVASLGQFCCVVFRARADRHLEILRWLPGWLQELASSAGWTVGDRVTEVSSLGDNILVGLRVRMQNLPPSGSLLVLVGFEEAQRRAGARRAGPLQQLNVQRDLLVKEFACPWILLMEPETDRLMSRIAPDFADFVALRVGPEGLVLPDNMVGRTASKEFTRELEDALVSMFGPDELRRLIYRLPDGETLVAELPSGPVSLRELAHDATTLIRRHGLEESLLEAMEQHRRGRMSEIQRLRSLAGLSAASALGSPLVQSILDLPLSGREELYMHLGAVLQRRFSLRETTPQQLYEAAQRDPKAMSALIEKLRDISSDRYS